MLAMQEGVNDCTGVLTSLYEANNNDNDNDSNNNSSSSITEHYISALCNQYLAKSNRAISTTLFVCMLKTMYNNNIFSLQQIKIHLKW